MPAITKKRTQTLKPKPCKKNIDENNSHKLDELQSHPPSPPKNIPIKHVITLSAIRLFREIETLGIDMKYGVQVGNRLFDNMTSKEQYIILYETLYDYLFPLTPRPLTPKQRKVLSVLLTYSYHQIESEIQIDNPSPYTNDFRLLWLHTLYNTKLSQNETVNIPNWKQKEDWKNLIEKVARQYDNNNLTNNLTSSEKFYAKTDQAKMLSTLLKNTKYKQLKNLILDASLVKEIIDG